MKKLFVLIAILSIVRMLPARGSDDGILIETESFGNTGGWVLDQQFMDQMGSPYLLAHGLGRPVRDAETTVNIPVQGTWHVYARTYNWTSPWTASPGPGKFKVRIAGKQMKNTLGQKAADGIGNMQAR